jgi:hypothetical protein
MKTLILLFATVFTLSAFGQAKTMTTVGSPVTNTGTATSTIKLEDTHKQVTLQAIVTKTSGTLAGTITLQGSLNDTNYVTIPTQAVVGAASTYTVTDVATQSVAFIVNNSPYRYFRLSWTGAGTMVGTLRSLSVGKKQ